MNMTNEKIDELKTQANELGNDLKYKAKEAQLQGEKAVDDLKHSAEELKLKGGKALDDLKKDVSEQNEEGKQAFSSKAQAQPAYKIPYPNHYCMLRKDVQWHHLESYSSLVFLPPRNLYCQEMNARMK